MVHLFWRPNFVRERGFFFWSAAFEVIALFPTIATMTLALPTLSKSWYPEWRNTHPWHTLDSPNIYEPNTVKVFACIASYSLRSLLIFSTKGCCFDQISVKLGNSKDRLKCLGNQEWSFGHVNLQSETETINDYGASPVHRSQTKKESPVESTDLKKEGTIQLVG